MSQVKLRDIFEMQLKIFRQIAALNDEAIHSLTQSHTFDDCQNLMGSIAERKLGMIRCLARNREMDFELIMQKLREEGYEI